MRAAAPLNKAFHMRKAAVHTKRTTAVRSIKNTVRERLFLAPPVGRAAYAAFPTGGTRQSPGVRPCLTLRVKPPLTRRICSADAPQITGAHPYCFLGRQTVNSTVSSALTAETVPPCKVTISLAIASPSPAPPVLDWRALSTRKNCSKIRSSFS